MRPNRPNLSETIRFNCLLSVRIRTNGYTNTHRFGRDNSDGSFGQFKGSN